MEGCTQRSASPQRTVHVPGLGWVSAVPIRELRGLSPAPPAPDRRKTDRRRSNSGKPPERRRDERRGPDRRRDARVISIGSAEERAEPRRTNCAARRFLLVGFLMAAVLSAVGAGAMGWTMRRTIEQTRWAIHASEVLLGIERTRAVGTRRGESARLLGDREAAPPRVLPTCSGGRW